MERECSMLGRDERLAYKISVGEPERRIALIRLEIEGRMIFKWIIEK
jgi:uncharacterized small protein (DUF1192 family)